MDYYFPYRGDIRASVGVETAVYFVTTHPEGLLTALYKYVPEDDEVTEQALPCGGVAICADAAGVYVGGSDQRVYAAVGKKAPKALTEPFAAPISAVVSVSQDRLGVVSGKAVHLVSRNDGKTLQTLELPETGTCAGADKTGAWLAVGGEKGSIAVFDGQDKAEFEPAESGKVHDGAVTAILFEPEELRFFSAGTDHKLLTTHARGALEPEDKGRANNHTDAVTALLHLPTGDRLISGSRDSTVKNWPRSGAVKPATLSDKVGKVVALALVTQYDDPRVAVLCDDATIRLLPINEEDGRFDDDLDDIDVAHGAVAWAEDQLADEYDGKRREAALKQLAGWNDAASLDRVAAQLGKDKDQAVRVTATKLLGQSTNPRAVTLLEPFVSNADDKVRVEAFKGLQNRLGATDPRPIDAALKTGLADVGVLAVKALEPLAKADDQSLAKLTAALDANTWDVRKQSLASLEGVFDSDSPQASLTALNAKNGDLRALALTRLFSRKMLDRPEVLSAVRRKLEDDDAAVRKVAFLLSVEARPALATFLRSRDEDLHRQLNELEGSDKKQPAASDKAKDKLDDADFDTLLQATAGRALDTCLRGAKGLAVLGDPRAFPLLLQLSREEQEYARVEVCRALSALGDDRAVNRLRSLLLDPQPSVRDAAYTAVAKLYTDTPLSAADAGLAAGNDDVRQRGVQTLLDATKKSKPKDGDPAWGLFVRAMNDPTAGVRREVFKAALNQGIGGGGEGTLRFALKSIHADIRREALTEVQAQIGEAWATPLLHEFFNDADPGVRNEAFEFATKKTKELAPLEAALKSRCADARLLAIDGLFKKHTKAAQAVILSALTDGEEQVRRAAVAALIDDDAKDALSKALAAEQPDVRARAAAALAKYGDPAALPVLRALAFAPEPDDKLKLSAWKGVVQDALVGLTELGDPAVFPGLIKLLDSPHADLRALAGLALLYCTPADGLDAVRVAMGHADPVVRTYAAQTLAVSGDATVHPLLFAPEAEKLLGAGGQLNAVAALGPAGASRLSGFLDSADDVLRKRTLLLHLLYELAGTDGHPDLLLQALSAKHPRVRLAAAEGLEAFHDPAAFREFVRTQFNDRGDETAWKFTAEAVDELASVVAFGSPTLRARAFALTQHFGQKEQAKWDQAWGVFVTRYATEVTAAKAKRKPTASKLTHEELRELAFGAYVGLAREQGGANSPAVGRVRQTALSRIHAIALANKQYARAAQPVFSQALSDPNQPVRLQAFEHLQGIGVSKAVLGAEALEAGYTDLGVKGLELLTDGTSSKDGEAVLERVLLSRTDDLATEAAKLLIKARKTVPVATVALDAVHEPLRTQAVNWLAGEYDDSADAQKALRGAVQSRYRMVREVAAFNLATKKDPAAFDTLAALLTDSSAGVARQLPLIAAFQSLGDLRAVGVLLDRIENDPTGTAQTDELFEAVGSFRVEASAGRLLVMADKNKNWHDAAFDAVHKVSGFDQDLPDADDEPAFAKVEKESKPFRPEVLAKQLEFVIRRGEADGYTGLIRSARVSRGTAVDAPLSTLTAHPDEGVRHAAVEAVGWRAKKRSGPVEPLLKALKHKDPTTQFLAAEGLAHAGKSDGLQVLLSGIEYLEDVDQRQRAVLALGELSDSRAVDTLLKLANENGHALQEAAAEAIGHLRRSAKGEEVGRTLERLAKSPMQGVMQRALKGLRWFDSPAGWQVIRQKAKDTNWRTRMVACEQLGYDTDPTTKDLLLDVLRKDTDNDATGAALEAALRLFGQDSLEPFYAAVTNDRFADYSLGKQGRNPVEIVCDKGDPLRLLDLFPKCEPEIQQKLEASLTTRTEIPAKEAAAALTHADDATVRLAARLLAKAPKPTPDMKKAAGEAVGRWWAEWQTRRTKLERGQGEQEPLDRAGHCLQTLFWTARQLGGSLDVVNEVVVSRPTDPLAKGVRLDALRTLAGEGKPTAATLKTLEQVASDIDADVRTLSAALIAKHDPKRAAGLLAGYLTDKPTFARVVGGGVKPADVVKPAAANPHQQSVALQPLVAAKDVPTLAAVAKDRKASEPARLGAIEGLGFMAFEEAEEVLVEIGGMDGDDEDVRKAAWRALRRSKRRRKKQKVEANGAT